MAVRNGSSFVEKKGLISRQISSRDVKGAHECSDSAAGPLIVFEPPDNVTSRGQDSLLSKAIISETG